MFKHGLSKHPLHTIWSHIKRRCTKTNDVNFKWYGAKGITICLEWANDFKSFYDWCMKNKWSEGLSIDRIDNSKGYCPDNCTFITLSQNSIKRNSESPVNNRGSMNPNAKLTLEDVLRLKSDLLNNIARKKLSDTYKISVSHIYRIKNGLRWNSEIL